MWKIKDCVGVHNTAHASVGEFHQKEIFSVNKEGELAMILK